MLEQQGPQSNYEARTLQLLKQSGIAQAKIFTHCGQRSLIACDRACGRAWGVESRPKDDSGEFFLSDAEIAGLPLPEIPEKTQRGEFNRWCIDSCERSAVVRHEKLLALPDCSSRTPVRLKYNALPVPAEAVQNLKLIYRNLINERPGWVIQHVPDSERVLGYCYTIGLWQKFRHPEIFVSHLRPAIAAMLLDMTAQWVATHPTELLPVNAPIFKIGQYSMMLAEVPTSNITGRHFAMGMEWYQGDDSDSKFPVHQLIWPDRWNRMPGHPRYNTEAPQEILAASTEVTNTQDYIFRMGALPR